MSVTTPDGGIPDYTKGTVNDTIDIQLGHLTSLPPTDKPKKKKSKKSKSTQNDSTPAKDKPKKLHCIGTFHTGIAELKVEKCDLELPRTQKIILEDKGIHYEYTKDKRPY